VLSIVVTFAFASDVAAQVPSRSKGFVYDRQVAGPHHRGYVSGLGPRGGRLAYAYSRGHRTRFAALVGDPESGLGFYPLPMRYRIGAWRYRLRNPRPYWQNPVLSAMAADAVRCNAWIPADRGYVCGVYNPIDGVGTPFFAGYYGPVGDAE
jgi:hypothetical protein